MYFWQQAHIRLTSMPCALMSFKHCWMISEVQIISMADTLLQEDYTHPFYVQLFRDGASTLVNPSSSGHLIDYPLPERYITLCN